MKLLDFFKDFLLYPVAETIHWLQGIITGWCAAHGMWKKVPSSAITALLIAIVFISYEITEQWKVNDNAYRDIENYWVMAVITGIIYTILHFKEALRNE